MKSISLPVYLAMFMVVILSATTYVSIYGYTEINKRHLVITDLYQLKSDILTANISIRNAAIAINEHDRGKELDKMLLTREDANSIYDRLTAAELPHLERTILEEMKKERKEYRESQIKVVNFIQLNDDMNTWHSMSYYQTLMNRYLQRVDVMLKFTLERTTNTYEHTKAAILAMLAAGIILTSILFWRIIR